jgi:hypothetical protein
MFLIPTFCEIAKNDSYIFKKLKKDPISFSVVKNGQFHLFVFQVSYQNAYLAYTESNILILVPTFCKIGKNGPYIL